MLLCSFLGTTTTHCVIEQTVGAAGAPSAFIPNMLPRQPLWQVQVHSAQTGRVFTASQPVTASNYLQHNTSTQYLPDHGHEEHSLPNKQQRNQWLKRQRRWQDVPSTPRDHLSVDAVTSSIANLNGVLSTSHYESKLYIFPGAATSESAVFIPFSCDGMLQVLDSYQGSHMLLGTDGKLDALSNGWRVISVGITVKKDGQTTFSRSSPRSAAVKVQAKRTPQGQCQRIRGRGTVSTIVLLLQAAVNSEPTVSFTFLYATGANCDERRSRRQRCPCTVLQLHKDFAEGRVFPTTRPMNDWTHSTSRNVKTPCQPEPSPASYGRVLSVLKIFRVLPKLDIFDCLWRALLKLMRITWGAVTFSECGMNPIYSGVSRRRGVVSLFQGQHLLLSASFHRQWQADFDAEGKVTNLDISRLRMQRLHKRWCVHLAGESRSTVQRYQCQSFPVLPCTVDDGMEAKSTMHTGRYQITNFRNLPVGVRFLSCLHARTSLFPLTLLVLGAIGVLTLDTPPQFVPNTFRDFFTSTHIVFLKPPWMATALGFHMVCSCATFALESMCELKDSTFQASRDSGTLSCRQSQQDEGKGGLLAL